MPDRTTDLRRIDEALRAAAELLRSQDADTLDVEYKQGAGPVTEADRAADDLLLKLLRRDGDGWLSEERPDDGSRLDHDRVWIVDPLDGTHEFLAGIPEWCVSIGLVEHGVPVAGGVCNPVTDEVVLGAIDHGVTVNDEPVVPRPAVTARADAVVLASRSETRRGEWRDVTPHLNVQPTGSVAWKIGLVAAGRADATWTFRPKSEWDVAGGAALVLAAGGAVFFSDGSPVRLNRPSTRLPGFAAIAASGREVLEPFLETRWQR